MTLRFTEESVFVLAQCRPYPRTGGSDPDLAGVVHPSPSLGHQSHLAPGHALLPQSGSCHDIR